MPPAKRTATKAAPAKKTATKAEATTEAVTVAPAPEPTAEPVDTTREARKAPAKRATVRGERVPHKVGSRDLTLGDTGADVEYLQRQLGVTSDGEYGPETARAVRRWQKARGRNMSGTVNARMWRDLGATDAG